MKIYFTKSNSFTLLHTLSIFIFTLLVTTGCGSAIQKKSPAISHVHIGHTLNGWVTTPGKKGLLATSEQEARVVLDQATKANKSSTLAQKKKYMANALHALDPKIQTSGPGTGYGLIRAVTESIAHLQYSANSNDASVNIKRTVPTIVNKAKTIASESNQLKVFAQAATNSSSTNEFNALNNEFLKSAKKISGDGSTNSYSLMQFRKDILAMTKNEKPAYTTVDSYFLFNLIRLPNGRWAYSSKNKADEKSADPDGSGGGY